MKNILLQRQAATFLYLFLILNLGLSAQTNPATKIALQPKTDSTFVTFLDDKMFMEDYKKFKKKYICQTIKPTVTTKFEILEALFIKEILVAKFIGAVNIVSVSYFKSGGITYYSINLETDFPAFSYRKLSRINKDNIG